MDGSRYSEADAFQELGSKMTEERRGFSLVQPLLLPGFLLAFGMFMPSLMFQHEAPHPADGAFGPAAWPETALLGLAILSAIWFGREIIVMNSPDAEPTLVAPADSEGYNYGRAALWIGLILAYGWLLPYTGFPLTTVIFITVWCFLGGLQSPFLVLSMAFGGTFVLLWVFMGLALMPLSRGTGIFDTFTIWLLHTVGIY
ncbi:tripartite tricarboxylate transporter TctB family protein [Amaricoccus macauensis]|uniref:tripartite tricarboxylate transporter TctB family protein n=1 Tax=Amaricoccus macauensis TaxID=57001 RepID=UPI003C7E9D4F